MVCGNVGLACAFRPTPANPSSDQLAEVNQVPGKLFTRMGIHVDIFGRRLKKQVPSEQTVQRRNRVSSFHLSQQCLPDLLMINGSTNRSFRGCLSRVWKLGEPSTLPNAFTTSLLNNLSPYTAVAAGFLGVFPPTC